MNSLAAMVRVIFLIGAGVFSAEPAGAQTTPAAPAPAGAPDLSAVIPELHVGDKVYYDVHVRQVTALAVIFLHRGGLASVPLANLPAELQQRFGYNLAKAATETARREAEARALKIKADAAPGDKGPPVVTADEILRRFGQPPKIYAEVSMQPRFLLLGIDAKNQGVRPSCAIFAMVSALEYQQAPLQGPAPRLSEEYLIWATLKTLGKVGLRLPKQDMPGYDAGFSLHEVADALRAYGVALEQELPYHLSAQDPRIVEPTPDTIERAKKRSPVNGFYITGREPMAQISNLVQVLNAGVPVVVGINWPDENLVQQNNVLDAQAGREKFEHAILLVGYRTRTGKIEDMEFMFKNSYGEKWGDHGYGLVTYRYLAKNLGAALFLDVR